VLEASTNPKGIGNKIMQKIITLMLTLTLLVFQPITLSDLSAQSAKTRQKELNKQYKKQIKNYKKEGWKLFGSSNTIEVALIEHYDKLNEGMIEFEVTTISTSKSIGKEKLHMAACAEFAKQLAGDFQGHITEDLGEVLRQNAADDANAKSIETLCAAYENSVARSFKGELKLSYGVFRENVMNNGKKMYEFKAYYLINPGAVERASLTAFEEAAKESAILRAHATQVSEWIKSNAKDAVSTEK